MDVMRVLSTPLLLTSTGRLLRIEHCIAEVTEPKGFAVIRKLRHGYVIQHDVAEVEASQT